MGKTGADIKTTRAEIIDYWSSRVYEGDLGTDWCDAHERCWRCGIKKKEKSLQRCHIIPAQPPFDGPDTPANLILLCTRCHEEAPSCTDANEMWSWIKATRASLYDIYWVQRDWEEIKRVHGLDIGHELQLRDTAACMNVYEQLFEEEVGSHLGNKPFSVASKVYVWRKVFAQIQPSSPNLEQIK